MRNLLALIAVVGLISTAACKKEVGLISTAACKKEEKAAEPVTTEPKAEPKADEPKAEPKPDKPEMANKMEHCPSSVEGAETEVVDGKGTVMVHVTAKDEAATAEIRKRAMHLAGLNDADSTEVKHSGSGTGGGVLGKCPVAVGTATVAAMDMEGGSMITLTPKSADGLADLSKMVKDRASGMAAGGAMKKASDSAHVEGKDADKHGGDGSGTGGGGGGGGGGDKKK